MPGLLDAQPVVCFDQLLVAAFQRAPARPFAALVQPPRSRLLKDLRVPELLVLSIPLLPGFLQGYVRGMHQFELRLRRHNWLHLALFGRCSWHWKQPALHSRPDAPVHAGEL